MNNALEMGRSAPASPGGLVGAARLLRQPLSVLARAFGHRPAPSEPAEVMLDLEPEAAVTPPVAARRQPPPIPADACRRPPTAPGMTAQELAWQELMSGRHPRWITRPLARPSTAGSNARPA